MELNGEKAPIAEWARRLGFKRITLSLRRRRGDTGQALVRPVRQFQMLTFDGFTRGITWWAKAIGCRPSFLALRLKRDSLEKVLADCGVTSAAKLQRGAA